MPTPCAGIALRLSMARGCNGKAQVSLAFLTRLYWKIIDLHRVSEGVALEKQHIVSYVHGVGLEKVRFP